MSKFSAAKGTKDILPKEAKSWQLLEGKIRELCANFGYNEIRTPEFEYVGVFQRGIGDETDIVKKEMYTFTRDKDTFCLKPEGTSGVIRAYIENGMASEPSPVKLYYITSCYRGERPQKGRQRQFHQFGIEAIGSDNPIIDAQVISLANNLFKTLGLKNISLKINSVGCPNCRKDYYEKLKEFLTPNLDKLCGDCKERLEKNPMRVLDCKVESCKEIIKDAPRMVDHLCEACDSHLKGVEEYLKGANIVYELDPNIVRGLDYYTQTAFEFISTDLGAQATVCGGGRYNGLIEMLGGSKTSGIGFGLGLERLLLIMEEQGLLDNENDETLLYIASLGKEESLAAFKLSSELTLKGYNVIIDTMGRSLKAQMKYADKIKAKYVAIIGEEELKNSSCLFRDMKTKEQEEIKLESIEEKLKSLK